MGTGGSRSAFSRFYLSADGPRLRRWIAGIFPAPGQTVFLTVWQTTIEETGGYVAALLTLAVIDGVTTAVVFWGDRDSAVLARPERVDRRDLQFLPTIGTYLAIVLPVIVGLQPDRPIVGVPARLGRALPAGRAPLPGAADQRQGYRRPPRDGVLRLPGEHSPDARGASPAGDLEG